VERCPVAWLQTEELVPGWPCSKYVLHEVPSRFLAFVPSPFFFHLHSTFYPCLFSPDLSSDFLCVSLLVTHREPFITQVWSPSTDIAVVLTNSESSLCFPFCGNCHEIDSSISSSLSFSLSLSASLTGSSCGANNIRSRRPEYWPISSFSISSPVTCSADSRYHHDVTYEARNQQEVSVCQCFRRSRRGNNPWSLQSHTEPRRRSESSAGTMFATQTAMLTLAYFLNSDMGHKTIP
jgi:hypothetical protein